METQSNVFIINLRVSQITPIKHLTSEHILKVILYCTKLNPFIEGRVEIRKVLTTLYFPTLQTACPCSLSFPSPYSHFKSRTCTRMFQRPPSIEGNCPGPTGVTVERHLVALCMPLDNGQGQVHRGDESLPCSSSSMGCLWPRSAQGWAWGEFSRDSQEGRADRKPWARGQLQVADGWRGTSDGGFCGGGERLRGREMWIGLRRGCRLCLYLKRDCSGATPCTQKPPNNFCVYHTGKKEVKKIL